VNGSPLRLPLPLAPSRKGRGKDNPLTPFDKGD